MSAEFEIMGVTTTTETEFDQPRDEVIDISQFTEAAVLLTAIEMDRNGGTTSVILDTAVDLAEDRWAELCTIKSFTADPASFPHNELVYLGGPGAGGGSDHPGFARYLRVIIDQAAGASITLDVKAVLKP